MIERILRMPARAQVVGVSWAFFGLLGPSLLQLLYTLVAARGLNPTEFGRLQLCVSVGTIMMAFSGLGAGGLVLRQVSRDPDRAAEFLGESIVWTLLVGPLFIALALAVMFAVAQSGLPLVVAISIACAELISWRIAMNCQQVFIGFGQQYRAAVCGMFIPLGRLVAALIIVAVLHAPDLSTFAMTYVASTFVAMLIALSYTAAQIGAPVLHLRRLDLIGGLSFAMTSFNAAVQVECDKLVLAFFTTPADVGVYSVATRLMDGAFAPTRALKQTIQSRLYKAGAEGSVRVISIALTIMPIVVGYGLLAWVSIVVLTPAVVWAFGPHYSGLAHILPLIGALPLSRSLAEIGSEVFLASDRARFQTFMQISTTLLRIALAIGLISMFGLDGAVAAALISSVVIASVYWPVAWVVARRHRKSQIDG